MIRHQWTEVKFLLEDSIKFVKYWFSHIYGVLLFGIVVNLERTYFILLTNFEIFFTV